MHADAIEWFARTVKGRENLLISVHPHNDRGTAVAAAELAMMAGADRVEGTLFGNGERTGNVDLITLALNLHTQGIDPGLDLSDIDAIRRVAEDCTGIPVHPRHPYGGDLVYTAFSGSHQDAIAKGFAARKKGNDPVWEVPYLPIDPADVGRSYEAVIRINSQSGKGGVAFVLERDHGLDLPRGLKVDFARHVQAEADRKGRELGGAEIWATFQATYFAPGRLTVEDYATRPHAGGRQLTATLSWDGRTKEVEGIGAGPVDAFVHALDKDLGIAVRVVDYREHAVGTGSEAQAACYVEIDDGKGGRVFGAALDPNVTLAALKAVTGAVNRR